MNLQIKGTRYEPAGDIIAQTNKQVGALARFIDESKAEAQASVELERAVGNQQSGDVWRAEITITHEGAIFRAESTKAHLDHAITTVARDVERELKRARGKKRDMVRKGSGMVKSFFQGFGKQG